MNNLLSSLPTNSDKEIFEEILSHKNIRIELIISFGHTSPETGWYDQEENEWVLVISGYGTLLFEDGRQQKLKKGDYINIPSHTKHKVIETSFYEATIWLAVFYKDE